MKRGPAHAKTRFETLIFGPAPPIVAVSSWELILSFLRMTVLLAPHSLVTFLTFFLFGVKVDLLYFSVR